MKKKMYRAMALIGTMALLTVGLAGCKKSECEWCGKEAHCKTVYLNMLGEYSMCKECRKVVEPISDNLKEFDDMENGK